MGSSIPQTDAEAVDSAVAAWQLLAPRMCSVGNRYSNVASTACCSLLSSCPGGADKGRYCQRHIHSATADLPPCRAHGRRS